MALQSDAATDRLVEQTRAHRAFHDALTEACGSRWLLRLLKTLNDHAERYRCATLPRGSVMPWTTTRPWAPRSVSRHPLVTELLWSHRSGYHERLAQRLEDEESATNVA